jgi:hypothetical protein
MKRRIFLLLSSVVALAAGFIFGMQTVFAVSGVFFAGYDYTAQSNAVRAYLPFYNPNVPSTVGSTDFSTEWVMANDGCCGYVQAGWLKYRTDTSGPQYFFEYDNGCGGYCRFRYGTINTSVHRYKVELVGGNWCGYIDSTQKDCGPTGTIGFSTAPKITFSGETTNTDIQLGGTVSSPYRMYTLERKRTDGVWFGINTGSLGNITTAGTSYRASTGFDTTTYVRNWTQ